MFTTAIYAIDPQPFMQFLTVACLTFVVGASASSVMKEYKRGNIEEARIRNSQPDPNASYTDEEEQALDYDEETLTK